jgi:hypothetical protein
MKPVEKQIKEMFASKKKVSQDLLLDIIRPCIEVAVWAVHAR